MGGGCAIGWLLHAAAGKKGKGKKKGKKGQAEPESPDEVKHYEVSRDEEMPEGAPRAMTTGRSAPRGGDRVARCSIRCGLRGAPLARAGAQFSDDEDDDRKKKKKKRPVSKNPELDMDRLAPVRGPPTALGPLSI